MNRKRITSLIPEYFSLKVLQMIAGWCSRFFPFHLYAMHRAGFSPTAEQINQIKAKKSANCKNTHRFFGEKQIFKMKERFCG